MASPRIESLYIKNFKSIGAQPIRLTFPENGPLVLLGENNAGKSNIGKALELLFGERWPKSYQPDDHDFHGRSSDGIDLRIGARVSGIDCHKCWNAQVSFLRWEYDKQRGGDPCEYSFSCSNQCNPNRYVPNTLREQLSCILIGADRRLGYQLSYSSKYTLLSKLMHRFHARLTNDATRIDRLRAIFEATVAEFSTVQEFSTFRDLLRTTTANFGQNLAYQLDVDFAAYDPSNFFRSLRLQAKLGQDVRTFDELGTGQEQILALAFAYSYARAFSGETGLILAIDEPESNLHPIAQQWLAEKLQELSSQDGLQVILTTHSPHFVDLSRPETLALVRKDGVDDASIVTQVATAELAQKLVERGADADKTQPETVGAFYAAAATSEIKTGLFARACVLVEGDTERLALPILLQKYGYDTLRHGVAVVPVGGVSNLPKWQRLFDIFNVPTYPIFDTDSDKSGKQRAERERDRRDLLTALGEDPDLAVEVAGEPVYLGAGYAAFDANFEAAMQRISPARWRELAAESIEFVGNSKPLQARYTASRIGRHELLADGDQLLARLTDSIASFFGHSYAQTPL